MFITEYIKISELKDHPRNKEFFDDITGEAWEDFKKSISERGVVEPIVITQDNVIVSGHQRVKACEELGITEVPCRQRAYESEDQILQDLIETNIRQRGAVGGSRKKVAKRIEELERIYGIQNGGDRKSEERSERNNFALISTQEELAEKLGITRRTLQNYKALLKMIPELEDLVDTGIVSTTTAIAIVKELSPEEQKEFLESLPEVKKLTEKKARELMAEYKETQKPTEENEDLKQELKTTKEELKITEEERSEFKKKYSEAKDELKRYKETFGNDKNILSATQEIQLLTAATNEYVKRHGGKVWAFNEFDKLDPSVKEDYIKSLKMLNAFTQQMIINVGGNIV